MELTYQSPMMPAAYAVISADEMTYIDGGALQIGSYLIEFHPENLLTAAVNFTVNFAHLMGKAVEAGEVYPGIAVCGTGNGISMTLNKHRGVRAALCWREDIAKLAREHNDANVLSMPGRFISKEEAKKIVEIFLDTPFEGGRHQRRIDKIPL